MELYYCLEPDLDTEGWVVRIWTEFDKEGWILEFWKEKPSPPMIGKRIGQFNRSMKIITELQKEKLTLKPNYSLLQKNRI
jgi:hypothetical protein